MGEVKDNKSITTEIELNDSIFTIPDSWSEKKKNAYKEAFIKAGFENVSHAKPKKEESNLYFAYHPDNKEDEKVNGIISVTVAKKEIELECVDGIVTTDNKKVYNALLKKGYAGAKPAEDIE